jgi:hypothetical protein
MHEEYPIAGNINSALQDVFTKWGMKTRWKTMFALNNLNHTASFGTVSLNHIIYSCYHISGW